jgi:hypothetical protein
MPDFKKLFHERMHKINHNYFLKVESSGGFSKVDCNSRLCLEKYISVLRENSVKFTVEGWCLYLPTENFKCSGIKYSEVDLDKKD